MSYGYTSDLKYNWTDDDDRDRVLLVTYSYLPGGLADSEDEAQIITVADTETGESIERSRELEQDLYQAIFEQEANSDPVLDGDWRNEW